MNRNDAIPLITGGFRGVAEWNHRRALGEFHPPNLSKANFAGALMDRIDLSYTNLEGANLTGAKLTGADLQRARLCDAVLTDAVLTDAYLQDTNLAGAKLSGVNFARTTLAHVDFEGATLDGASFVEAWMIGGRFVGASMKGAIFGRTYLSSVLQGALGLAEAKHLTRSRVALDTLRQTEPLPDIFRRGCGIPDEDYALIRAQASKTEQFQSVFISYSHADQRAAEWLHRELQERGILSWLDSHDLKPGERILDVVDLAIRRHDRLLLCCSKQSLESWWVKDELRKAHERERSEKNSIIIPILFDRYLLEDWSDGLASDVRSRKAVDLTTWHSEGALARLELESLVRALRNQ